MSKHILIPIVIVAIAFAFVGAKEADRSPVEVGKTYHISNGASSMKGQIIDDLGNGWYRIKRNDGAGEMSINVANAFFVAELK